MIFGLTGKVGSGKNLFALALIEKYAFQGRRVVANFGTNLAPLLTWWDRVRGRTVPVVEQLPGRPSYEDIQALGKGGPREHRAGLLVLDECGPLLNAREWQDKSRGQFIDWLLHSRKLAWDVVLIVQNIGIVDKQIRISCIESLITVRRMDRLKWMGLRLPRMHLAVERYGTEMHAPIAERTFFRGSRYFKCYDTTELLGEFSQNEDEEEGFLTGQAEVERTRTKCPEIVPAPSLWQHREYIGQWRRYQERRRKLRACAASGQPLLAIRDRTQGWMPLPRLHRKWIRHPA